VNNHPLFPITFPRLPMFFLSFELFVFLSVEVQAVLSPAVAFSGKSPPFRRVCCPLMGFALRPLYSGEDLLLFLSCFFSSEIELSESSFFTRPRRMLMTQSLLSCFSSPPFQPSPAARAASHPRPRLDLFCLNPWSVQPFVFSGGRVPPCLTTPFLRDSVTSSLLIFPLPHREGPFSNEQAHFSRMRGFPPLFSPPPLY